ncbi:hypothetical protein GGF46_001466 [Coemansia sp. RSA 552]|nr:hypothetical protein GGF46_001466 [Coemansia sp. RSA 552]
MDTTAIPFLIFEDKVYKAESHVLDDLDGYPVIPFDISFMLTIRVISRTVLLEVCGTNERY